MALWGEGHVARCHRGWSRPAQAAAQTTKFADQTDGARAFKLGLRPLA
jgi:hypothetical protein